MSTLAPIAGAVRAVGWSRPLQLPTALALLATSLTMTAQDSPPAPAPRAVDTVTLREIPLWDGPAPEAKGGSAEDSPRLAILPAAPERANGCGVIVCPGGGYWVRAMDHEGLQVAQWLNQQGIHAFLLSYRIRTEGYDPPVAWTDARRAQRLVRARAAEFGVDPNRLGMIGFSAGAHLLSWVAARADAGDPSSPDPVERVSDRPDFLLMIYGSPFWMDRAEGRPPPPPVTDSVPPTFMVLTTTDFVPPEGCLRLLEELRRVQVETELHVFGGDGAHGRGLHSGDPDTGVWPTLAVNWMRRNNFLCGAERVAVEGQVTLDGEPLFMGWITFRPVDRTDAPSASVHLSDADRQHPKNGRYRIEPRFGPVPGRYRVEVREVAKDFRTVPTLAQERVFTRLAPDAPEMVVEIRPGSNTLDLPIRTR